MVAIVSPRIAGGLVGDAFGTRASSPASTEVPTVGMHQSILTPAALRFVAGLHRQFNGARLDLLSARRDRQARFDAGEDPEFLIETADVRRRDWRVAPLPADMQDRRVEITGPVDRKMVINALNSGASCYMADFEDSHSPTWDATVDARPTRQFKLKCDWQ